MMIDVLCIEGFDQLNMDRLGLDSLELDWIINDNHLNSDKSRIWETQIWFVSPGFLQVFSRFSPDDLNQGTQQWQVRGVRHEFHVQRLAAGAGGLREAPELRQERVVQGPSRSEEAKGVGKIVKTRSFGRVF